MHSTGVSILAEKRRLSAAWSRGTLSIARALHLYVDAITHLNHDHGDDWEGIVAGTGALSPPRDIPPGNRLLVSTTSTTKAMPS